MTEHEMLQVMTALGDAFADEDWDVTGLNRPGGEWVVEVVHPGPSWRIPDTRVIITNMEDANIFITKMSFTAEVLEA